MSGTCKDCRHWNNKMATGGFINGPAEFIEMDDRGFCQAIKSMPLSDKPMAWIASGCDAALMTTQGWTCPLFESKGNDG